MAKKQTIEGAKLITVVTMLARWTAGVVYEDKEEFEEVTVAELLEWMENNLRGQELVMEAAK